MPKKDGDFGSAVDYFMTGSIGGDRDNDAFMRKESQKPNKGMLEKAHRTGNVVQADADYYHRQSLKRRQSKTASEYKGAK